MCRWLGYGTEKGKSAADNLLCRREFSFTTGDDVYIRYLSYESADAFRMDLCKKLPYKIDIGAVFTADPRDHKKFKLFEPVQREFLIDIDLTDYEFLDCDVKKIETCDRCWPIMALAARVLNQMLVKDFGFEHLLFVYSGRRGIHCWSCDTRARVMSNDVRSAVADYLTPKLNEKNWPAVHRAAHAPVAAPRVRRAPRALLQGVNPGVRVGGRLRRARQGGRPAAAAQHARRRRRQGALPRELESGGWRRAEWAGEVEQPGQARARQEEPRALEYPRRDRLLLHLPAPRRQRE